MGLGTARIVMTTTFFGLGTVLVMPILVMPINFVSITPIFYKSTSLTLALLALNKNFFETLCSDPFSPVSCHSFCLIAAYNTIHTPHLQRHFYNRIVGVNSRTTLGPSMLSSIYYLCIRGLQTCLLPHYLINIYSSLRPLLL